MARRSSTSGGVASQILSCSFPAGASSGAMRRATAVPSRLDRTSPRCHVLSCVALGSPGASVAGSDGTLAESVTPRQRPPSSGTSNSLCSYLASSSTSWVSGWTCARQRGATSRSARMSGAPCAPALGCVGIRAACGGALSPPSQRSASGGIAHPPIALIDGGSSGATPGSSLAASAGSPLGSSATASACPVSSPAWADVGNGAKASA
eukprot:scaffold268_cov134-Isochrysis_galbana.AAC.15